MRRWGRSRDGIQPRRHGRFSVWRAGLGRAGGRHAVAPGWGFAWPWANNRPTSICADLPICPQGSQLSWSILGEHLRARAGGVFDRSELTQRQRQKQWPDPRRTQTARGMGSQDHSPRKGHETAGAPHHHGQPTRPRPNTRPTRWRAGEIRAEAWTVAGDVDGSGMWSPTRPFGYPSRFATASSTCSKLPAPAEVLLDSVRFKMIRKEIAAVTITRAAGERS
jgi:hypothetical protein